MPRIEAYALRKCPPSALLQRPYDLLPASEPCLLLPLGLSPPAAAPFRQIDPPAALALQGGERNCRITGYEAALRPHCVVAAYMSASRLARSFSIAFRRSASFACRAWCHQAYRSLVAVFGMAHNAAHESFQEAAGSASAPPWLPPLRSALLLWAPSRQPSYVTDVVTAGCVGCCVCSRLG
jgi:hypothetical protein